MAAVAAQMELPAPKTGSAFEGSLLPLLPPDPPTGNGSLLSLRGRSVMSLWCPPSLPFSSSAVRVHLFTLPKPLMVPLTRVLV